MGKTHACLLVFVARKHMSAESDLRGTRGRANEVIPFSLRINLSRRKDSCERERT